MLRIGIAGATGYAGIELVRLLSKHPHVKLEKLYSRQYAGKKISQVYPHLDVSTVLEGFDPAAVTGLDVLFLALPHAQSHAWMPALITGSAKIIDLSADFRLSDPEAFKKYYGVEHQAPQLLPKATLGFSEVYREDIAKAQLCANPGCYSTSVVLGLHPLAKNGFLNDCSVIVDAKSGVSGAGRHLKESSLYCEATSNLSAYGLASHRHVPEMERALSSTFIFSPHLVPMSRGILSSIYIDNQKNLTQDHLNAFYHEAYANEPFIKLAPDLDMPSTKYVTGSNRCMITAKVLKEHGKIVVFSAIDNLIKGASGQAIQNMNIMCGFPETTGLTDSPFYL